MYYQYRTTLEEALHIGLREESDGNYQWISAETVSYTNWSPGEPNGGTDGSATQYGHMYTNTGKWNDHPDSPINGIAEIPFIRRGDSAYVIVEGPTWEEAEANANALGGHLVTINDAEENIFLWNRFGSGWIGLSDSETEGIFKWADGEELTFQNWMPGEPNDMAPYGGGQDFVHLHSNGNGQWDDQSNGTNPYEEWEPKFGIAEIKLAPNNTPTGSLSIEGNMRVGQQITLNKDLLVDADNHEYWTPEYEYSWKISDDGGYTWQVLISEDATDGDSTYTITSDDANKEIRGVVSYLDGYGTKEEVSSESYSIGSIADVNVTGIQRISEYLKIDSVDIKLDGYEVAWLGWQQRLGSTGQFVDQSLFKWTFDYETETYQEHYGENLLFETSEFSSFGEVRDHLEQDNSHDRYEVTLNNRTAHIDVNFNRYSFTQLGDGVDTFLEGGSYGANLLSGPEHGHRSYTYHERGLHVLPRYNVEAAPLEIVSRATGETVDLGVESPFFEVNGYYVLNDYSVYIRPEFHGHEYRAYAALEDSDGNIVYAYSDAVEIKEALTPSDAGEDSQIKPQVPNNVPSGSVLLSGSLRVGETLNLDASSIADADGINSDPGLIVSWQLFDATTQDWTDLDPALAFNNGRSITIDDDWLDHDLRAQVRYVDGNGLTEIISSQAHTVLAAIVPVQQPDRALTLDASSAALGTIAEIPLTITDASLLQSFDVLFRYDESIFSVPSTGPLFSVTDLTSDWSIVVNGEIPGQIAISGSGTSPLTAGEGSLINLNLQVKDGIEPTSTTLDLVSASFNEEAIAVDLQDSTVEIIPPSFQIFSIRELPNGLALSLPEAPDLSVLNLYDGMDSSSDAPDLSLTDADGNRVALSAHWQDSSRELLLLSTSPLASGDYTLSIDSRADGLISASSAELLDGNGDGTSGDAFSYSFSHTAADHSLSIADTARGAAQQLSLNGAAVRDGITGLPVTLTTTAALTSIEGSLDFDPTQLLNAALSGGIDLPDDWSLTFAAPADGQLLFTASGTSSLTGADLELFRFDALINPNATKDANPDLYGFNPSDRRLHYRHLSSRHHRAAPLLR